jgi:AcrR family transcriptional regulator
MPMGRGRTAGQRAGITHADVLGAARDILAHRGLDALTMRAVAERLHVAPNALYSHVPSKTALLDDLLDNVLAQVRQPAADAGDPDAGLAALMTSTYEVLLAHPDLVALYLARQGARGPNAQRLGATMVTLLDRAGLPEPAAAEALRVLIIYTIGFAAFTGRVPLNTDLERASDPAELHANFRHGLAWLLAGVRQASPPGAP